MNHPLLAAAIGENFDFASLDTAEWNVAQSQDGCLDALLREFILQSLAQGRRHTGGIQVEKRSDRGDNQP